MCPSSGKTITHLLCREFALVPRDPRNSEAPLVIDLDAPSRVRSLPADVTAVGFGVGEGLVLIGRSDGTIGVARIPD